MTKSQSSMILRETKRVINLIKDDLHISVDSGEMLRLENFIGNRLMVVFYQGYGDGLQEAREIFFNNKKVGG